MEQPTVKLEIGYDKIQVALEKAAEELFKSSYNNPMLDLLKKAVEEKHGVVKAIVDEIIVSAISSPDFKEKISAIVIQRMVESALKK